MRTALGVMVGILLALGAMAISWHLAQGHDPAVLKVWSAGLLAFAGAAKLISRRFL